MGKGIPYFPLDCQLDNKFALIEAEFGLKGFAVVVKLLQRIYGQQGYYCEFTNEIELLFSREIGLSGNLVSEIVSAAIRRGIFDKDMFDKYQILTSVGIQERYLEAVSRRKNVEVKKQYLLLKCVNLPKNVCTLSENVYISEENADISKQRKEEKRKEEKSNIGAAAKPPPSPTKHKRGEYSHVLLSDVEYSALLSDFGEKLTAEYIKRLDEYLEIHRDKHYSNHNLVIRKWLAKEGVKKKSEIQSTSYNLDEIFNHALTTTPTVKKSGGNA